MKYSIEILGKERLSDGLMNFVRFRQEDRVYDRSYRVYSRSELDNKIKSEVDRLETIDALEDSLLIGGVEVAPDLILPEDPEHEKNRQYAIKFDELLKAKTNLDLGLIDISEYDVVKSEVISARTKK